MVPSVEGFPVSEGDEIDTRNNSYVSRPRQVLRCKKYGPENALLASDGHCTKSPLAASKSTNVRRSSRGGASQECEGAKSGAGRAEVLPEAPALPAGPGSQPLPRPPRRQPPAPAAEVTPLPDTFLPPCSYPSPRLERAHPDGQCDLPTSRPLTSFHRRVRLAT